VTVAHNAFKQDRVFDFPDFLRTFEQYSIDLFMDPELFSAELPHLAHEVQAFKAVVFIERFSNLKDRFNLDKLAGLKVQYFF